MVTVFDEDSLMASYKLCAELRQAGLDVYSYPVAEKLGKQFKHADRIGAKIALIIGPDEVKSEEVAIKDLTTREQVSVDRKDLVKTILSLLDNDKSA
jgi:histidyl-tRNA synthetase